MAHETSLILTISIIAIFIMLLGALLAILFKRATNDRAYIRTGYGGEVIVQNTGFFVLPILHRVLPINLKTMRLEIELSNESAALTKDHLKVDLSVDFYVRVIAEKESISQVARTLGKLTLFPEQLKDFLASHLIQAIRMVAAEMSMNEINQQQSIFVQKIQQAVTDNMIKNSLQLDSVTLKYLDQTSKEYFQEEKAFDTEGLSKLSEIIESEKKSRYEIKQQYRLESKQKELEMEMLIIEMDNKKSHLRLEQEREIKKFEAANALAITQDAIKKRIEGEQAQILAEQELEISKQSSQISRNIKLREKLKTQMETDLVKAEAVKAEQRVKSSRKLEKADCQVKIKLLKKKRKYQHETVIITAIAAARKDAASEEAETVRIKAEAEADKLRIIENSKLEAEKLIEENFKNRYQSEADGVKILIDAVNSLTKNELPHDVYLELIKLFSGLCIKNNQLMNQFGDFELDTENDFCNIAPITSKPKPNDSVNSKIGMGKLQAILKDARYSLAKEVLNTINEIDQENDDEILPDEVKSAC